MIVCIIVLSSMDGRIKIGGGSEKTERVEASIAAEVKTIDRTEDGIARIFPA